MAAAIALREDFNSGAVRTIATSTTRLRAAATSTTRLRAAENVRLRAFASRWQVNLDRAGGDRQVLSASVARRPSNRPRLAAIRPSRNVATARTRDEAARSLWMTSQISCDTTSPSKGSRVRSGSGKRGPMKGRVGSGRGREAPGPTQSRPAVRSK